MALVVKDRVKVSTTTTGTGTITLGAAAQGFQDFTVVGDGNQTYYAIVGGTDWEVGIGTVDLTGGTLSRDTVLDSTNSGSAVDWPAGDKEVFVTYPADKASVTFPAGARTANYTASINEGVLTDTTGGAFTVTLPASPIMGSQVVVSDAGGAWGTNNLTVGRNGETIDGVAQDLVCDINGVSVTLIYDGATWRVYAQVGVPTGSGAIRQTFTATSGQTTFTVAGGYSVGFVDVYLNGIKLVNGVDVTVTSGTDVVLATGAALNDVIDVVAYSAFDVANTYTQAQVDGFLSTKLPLTGGTMTGDIIFSGTQTFAAAQVTGLPTFPTGAIVGDTDTQTLTNKTIAQSLLGGDIKEKTSVSATAATGTINLDAATQQVVYFTANSTANFTVNIRGDGSNTLDSLMDVGDSITLAFLVTNGGTAYYNTAVEVDGASVTPSWQGGAAPTAGNASSIDAYSYVVIKTGSAQFTVLASQTQFA